MTATHSLAVVAERLNLTDDMADPVRWLTAQIKAGRITARKLGRSWRMTDEDIADALEVFANRRPVSRVAQPEPRSGLSLASSRRRLSA